MECWNPMLESTGPKPLSPPCWAWFLSRQWPRRTASGVAGVLLFVCYRDAHARWPRWRREFSWFLTARNAKRGHWEQPRWDTEFVQERVHSAVTRHRRHRRHVDGPDPRSDPGGHVAALRRRSRLPSPPVPGMRARVLQPTPRGLLLPRRLSPAGLSPAASAIAPCTICTRCASYNRL